MIGIDYLLEEDDDGQPDTLYRIIETSERISTAYFVKDEWDYDKEFHRQLDNLHEGNYRYIETKEAAEVIQVFDGEIDLNLDETDEKVLNQLIDAESLYNAFTEETMPIAEADEMRRFVKMFFSYRRVEAEKIAIPDEVEKLPQILEEFVKRGKS